MVSVLDQAQLSDAEGGGESEDEGVRRLWKRSMEDGDEEEEVEVEVEVEPKSMEIFMGVGLGGAVLAMHVDEDGIHDVSEYPNFELPPSKRFRPVTPPMELGEGLDWS